MSSFRSRSGKQPRSLLGLKLHNHGQLDGKKIVKAANLYFQNHPTCLKTLSDSDADKTSEDAKRKKSINYAKLLVDS